MELPSWLHRFLSLDQIVKFLKATELITVTPWFRVCDTGVICKVLFVMVHDSSPRYEML